MRNRLIVVAAIGAFVLSGTAIAASHSEARPTATPPWVTTAKQRLAKLETKAAGSNTGYEREKFGPKWYDVDVNDCDTRNDILARDLKQLVFNNSCEVAKGTLSDPYTGKTINFVRGKNTSLAVQIDHVVALRAAWRTGAKKWKADLKLFYANDPLVLLAVDGPTNNAKQDKDAANWLPPNTAYHCRYAAKQIAIKTKYELWVTQPERMKMSEVLSDC